MAAWGQSEEKSPGATVDPGSLSKTVTNKKTTQYKYTRIILTGTQLTGNAVSGGAGQCKYCRSQLTGIQFSRREGERE